MSSKKVRLSGIPEVCGSLPLLASTPQSIKKGNLEKEKIVILGEPRSN